MQPARRLARRSARRACGRSGGAPRGSCGRRRRSTRATARAPRRGRRRAACAARRARGRGAWPSSRAPWSGSRGQLARRSARTPARKRSAVSPNASSSRPISTARRVPIGSNGAEVSSRGHVRADAARQQVGPVLRAVQAAHVPVVGVEHDVLARQHVVGGERERHAAGGRVAGQRRDRRGASRSRSTSRTTSSIACRFRHDSAAGSSAASITFRWMPLEKKSRAAHQHDHARVARRGRSGRPRAAAGTGRCSSRRCRSRSAGSRRRACSS